MSNISDFEKRRIYEYFKENNFYPEIWGDDGVIKIYISWGDWKHEHLRCDWLMSELGYILINKFETEEDGSDCYCGEHWYVREIL